MKQAEKRTVMRNVNLGRSGGDNSGKLPMSCGHFYFEEEFWKYRIWKSRAHTLTRKPSHVHTELPQKEYFSTSCKPVAHGPHLEHRLVLFGLHRVLKKASANIQKS